MGQSCCTNESKDQNISTNIHLEKQREQIRNGNLVVIQEQSQEWRDSSQVKDASEQRLVTDMSREGESTITPEILYEIEDQDKLYHLELHQAAKRDKLKFTESMKMYDGSNYRGYLKLVIIDDGDSSLGQQDQIQKKEELVRHGPGVQVWPDGSKYEGEWFKGRAHGRGRMMQADGSVYNGSWADDKTNGFGRFTTMNGSVIEGQWFDDVQEGMGVEEMADGSKYEGMYSRGKRNGLGVLIWKDGSKYEGQWQHNLMNGKGIFTWPDGRRYEGEYLNDKMHGYGIYTWADGKQYEGNWKDGMHHGEGIYRKQGAADRRGLWEEGKRIKWMK